MLADRLRSLMASSGGGGTGGVGIGSAAGYNIRGYSGSTTYAVTTFATRTRSVLSGYTAPSAIYAGVGMYSTSAGYTCGGIDIDINVISASYNKLVFSSGTVTKVSNANITFEYSAGCSSSTIGLRVGSTVAGSANQGFSTLTFSTETFGTQSSLATASGVTGHAVTGGFDYPTSGTESSTHGYVIGGGALTQGGVLTRISFADFTGLRTSIGLSSYTGGIATFSDSTSFYTSGNVTINAAGSTEITRRSYATNAAIAVGANLSKAIAHAQGFYTSTEGFTAGGYYYSGQYGFSQDTVEVFNFVNQTNTATSTALTSHYRTFDSGVQG